MPSHNESKIHLHEAEVNQDGYDQPDREEITSTAGTWIQNNKTLLKIAGVTVVSLIGGHFIKKQLTEDAEIVEENAELKRQKEALEAEMYR